jgi:SAM-dependent methyltransferase
MFRTKVSQFIRSLGLLYQMDRINFLIEKVKNRKSNDQFIKDHPSVKLPPDYLIFESFQLNYKKYYSESMETSEWIVDSVKPYMSLKNINVLDWGCGPGRVIRHMYESLDKNCKLYGTDYNLKSINWCQRNLKNIFFNHNGIESNLPFNDNYFHLIYGISIFTHLSEEKHYEWFDELLRVLSPQGIMFFTTQGDNFRVKLSENEKVKYDNGELVVRGNVKEGHRTFSAFQPKQFMLDLFKDVTIESHLIRKPNKGKSLPQDVWIIRKKK